MEFKIGDRVKCIKDAAFNELGKVGTIIGQSNYGSWVVEFDENVGGHDGLANGNKTRGKNGHCIFRPSCFLVHVNDYKKIVVTTNGKTTTARLYDGNKVVKAAESKCNPNDKFDFETGAKLAVDRLLEEKKSESIKLYCVKTYGSGVGVTKGKIYTFENNDMRLDNQGFDDYYHSYADFAKRNQKYAECLIPLVRRPAKNGEFVYVIKNYRDAKVGDVILVDGKINSAGLDGFIWGAGLEYSYGNDTINKYLVLDGYTPEKEFKPHLECIGNFGDIGKQADFIDVLGNTLQVGDTVIIYNGTTKYGEYVVCQCEEIGYFVMGIANHKFVNGKSGEWQIVKNRSHTDIANGEMVGNITYIKQQ